MSITLGASSLPFWAELSTRILRLAIGVEHHSPSARVTVTPATPPKGFPAVYSAGGPKHGPAPCTGLQRWPPGQSAGALCGTSPKRCSSALPAIILPQTGEMAMFFRDESELTLTREWEVKEGLSHNWLEDYPEWPPLLTRPPTAVTFPAEAMTPLDSLQELLHEYVCRKHEVLASIRGSMPQARRGICGNGK